MDIYVWVSDTMAGQAHLLIWVEASWIAIIKARINAKKVSSVDVDAQ